MCLVKGWGKGGAWRRHRHDPSLLSVNSSYSYLPNNQTHRFFFYAWKQASCLMCPFNLHSHVQPGNVEMLLSSRQIQHNGKWRCIHNLKDFQFVFLQEEKKQLQRKKKKVAGLENVLNSPTLLENKTGHSCGNQLAGKGIQDRWQRWIMYIYRTRLDSFIWKTD